MYHNNLRPCLVRENKPGSSIKVAYFHRWADQTRIIVKAQEAPKETAPYFSNLDEVIPVSSTVGIVEYEDGSIGTVEPQEIKFTDAFMKKSYDMEPQNWHSEVVKQMVEKMEHGRALGGVK